MAEYKPQLNEALYDAAQSFDEERVISILKKAGCKLLHGQVYNTTNRRTLVFLLPDGTTRQFAPSSSLAAAYIIFKAAFPNRYTRARIVTADYGALSVITEGGAEIFCGYNPEAQEKMTKHNEGIEWAKLKQECDTCPGGLD